MGGGSEKESSTWLDERPTAHLLHLSSLSSPPLLTSHGCLAKGRASDNQELGYPMHSHYSRCGTHVFVARRSQLIPEWLTLKPPPLVSIS